MTIGRVAVVGRFVIPLLLAAPGLAAAQPNSMTWTTLGTAGGPPIHADRSQPANLLSFGRTEWLIDCGDGALERFATAVPDAQPRQISAVFISHLHLDHTAGLQGLIGLRWMQQAPGVLTIYGPPGIEAVVAGIIQSMQPVARIGLNAQKNAPSPSDSVKVVVLHDGSDVTVDGVRVRAVQNSHFDSTPGVHPDNGSQSLSYRFDGPGRSIGFTGDTGPSAAVTALFKGVDTMVSEVIDLQSAIADVNQPDSFIPPTMRPALIEHFKTQHLTPQEAGAIATAAGAKRLIFTHLAVTAPIAEATPRLISGAHETYSGPVSVAHDLEKF